jgi:hypothetical protein
MQGLVVIAQPLGSKGSVKGQVGTVTAGCLYRQAAGFWNVLDTLGDVIIGNHLSATRRFYHVPEPFMRFREIP